MNDRYIQDFASHVKHQEGKTNMQKFFRWNVFMFIGAVAIMLIGLGTIVAVLIIGPHGGTDSGVKACQTMAENAKHPKASNNEHMTESSYHESRVRFENSSYADIKVAGQNLVDTIYKADKASQAPSDDEDLGGTFALLSTLQNNWAALQVACANHDVDLPALSS